MGHAEIPAPNRAANFSLRQIRYFLAVARLGQVSRAAALLHVTQSAVTVALRELENALGLPLFARESHGMELTDDGRAFLEHALKIDAAVSSASQLGRASPVQGRIHLAATTTVLGYFLPEHLQRLHELHPQLEVALEELPRADIEAGLHDGRFDLGLMVTSQVTDPALSTQVLVESRRRLWLAAGHPWAGRDAVSLAEVARERLLMLTADEAAVSALRFWAAHGLSPTVHLRSASIEAIRSLVAYGEGVAIASDMQYRPWSLEGRRVETISVQEPIPPLTIGLAWPTRASIGPTLHSVLSYFRHLYVDPSPRHRPARR
jgi:DNA-binding transcriptional LysR family regulator